MLEVMYYHVFYGLLDIVLRYALDIVSDTE